MFEPYQVTVWITYVCDGCSATLLSKLGHTVWIKHPCPQCGGLDHHAQWSYTLYEEAKRLVGVFYTPPQQGWAACVICGKIAHTWMAHHIVSQRYKLGHNDIRNIVPVCSSRCHTEAHGSKKEEVLRSLYWVLGNADMVRGQEIFNQGKAIWLPKTGEK